MISRARLDKITVRPDVRARFAALVSRADARVEAERRQVAQEPKAPAVAHGPSIRLRGSPSARRVSGSSEIK